MTEGERIISALSETGIPHTVQRHTDKQYRLEWDATLRCLPKDMQERAAFYVCLGDTWLFFGHDGQYLGMVSNSEYMIWHKRES